ncbi:MAG: flippase-like domain-containing protein, partial [Anaerolineales bacterium]|nr:flippase-like domain-containing protein [Anaerolineales bacterium]
MSAQPGTSVRRGQWLRWFGSLLSLVLLVYLFSRHWSEIVLAFQQLEILSLFLALGLMLLSRFSVGMRWYILLKPVERRVTAGQVQRLTFAGLFASNFLPTTIGGDVVRLAGALQFKIDAALAAASLVVDRLVGMLGMALALPFGFPLLGTWLRADSGLVAALSAAPGGWLGRVASRARQLLVRLWRALQLWRQQRRALLVALLFTGLHQACLYLIMVLLLNDLGEPLPVWQLAGLWSFIYFVTLLPVSINGYGVQELALTFAFVQV